jgi:GT2 family glycosyltransferase
VVIVDNNSTDDTIQQVRTFGREAGVLTNTHNAGFAAAVNQGAKVAEGDFLVILNPDAIATAGALDKLAKAFESDNVGAAGGLLVDDAGRPQKGFTVRRFPTVGSTLAEVVLLNRAWPANPWNVRYRCLDLDYGEAQEVDQPAGACLAVRREAWESLNGFDEAFFPVWFEDVDFCRRLRDQGWKIVYCPDAIFSHAGGHSVNRLAFRDRQSVWYKNLLRYFSKHHSRSEVLLLRAGILVGLLFRALLSSVGFRPSGTSRIEAVEAYGHVIWHYAIRSRDT